MGCVLGGGGGGEKTAKTQKAFWVSWKAEQYSFMQTTLHGEWCVCSSEKGFPHSDAYVNTA